MEKIKGLFDLFKGIENFLDYGFCVYWYVWVFVDFFKDGYSIGGFNGWVVVFIEENFDGLFGGFFNVFWDDGVLNDLFFENLYNLLDKFVYLFLFFLFF